MPKKVNLTQKSTKKYRKAVRWCASLIRSLYWLIRLIWIGFLDLWVDLTDLVYLIEWMNPINHICTDVCSISCISWVQISWVITPKSKYLVVADFMRYYTRIKISHGCRFHEILHQNHNISWLQISWEVIPGLLYLIVAEPQYLCLSFWPFLFLSFCLFLYFCKFVRL